MFRIGVFELALSCGMTLLVLVIPFMVAKFYTRLDKRLKDIEKKIDNKK
jgi:hypothetical protein